MANSSAADKHPQARLLNPWALLPVALGVALVLWLTFNSEEVFMRRPGAGRAGAYPRACLAL